MLKRVRENKKGFTLAELLIVVAIIGVLVAVSIPIFTAQLSKARLATNQANARAAKAAAVAEILNDGTEAAVIYQYDTATGKATVIAEVDGTAASGTDISAWTTTTDAGLATAVYKTWYVTFDATATSVTAYNYK